MRSARILALALVFGCGPKEADPLAVAEPTPISVTQFLPDRAALVTRPIDVKFSVAVVGPSEVGVDVPGEELLVISPALPGRCRWIAQDELRFVPSVPFADGARYRVEIRPGAVGEGRVLTGATAFDFPTRMFTLASVEVNPKPDEQTARVVLELTHPVRPAEANAAVSFRDVDGKVVPSRIVTAEDQRLMTFLIGPLRGDFANLAIEVHVDGSLRSIEGGHPLEKEIVRPVPLVNDGTMSVQSVTAFQDEERLGVRVRLDRSVDAPSIRAALTLRPDIRHTISVRHHGFDILGSFRAARPVTIQLAPGLESVDGYKLPERVEHRVVMPSLAPALRLRAKEGIELFSVNVPRVDVRVTKIWDDNVAHLTPHLLDAALPASSSFGTVVYRGSLDTAGRADDVVTSAVPYEDPYESRPGLYHVEVVDAERAWVRAGAWVLDDGLSLTAKVGPSQVRAEVLSPATLRPVYNAVVRVVSRTNRRLGTARTSANGVAIINVDADPDDPPAWVLARRGRKFAYLPLAQTRVSGGDPGPERGRAFLFGDKRVYRTGETARFGAVVRSEASLSESAPLPTLSVRGPLGEPLEVTPAGRATGGAALFDVVIPTDAREGRYELRATSGDRGVGHLAFWVDGATPPRLVADVRVDRSAKGLRTPAFDVEARYRLGKKPASGLVLRTRCRYREAPFVPDGFESFRFGTTRGRLLDLVESEVESKLDAKGTGKRWCPSLRATGATGPVRITLDASVVEPGGRVVESEASIVHQPTAHQVGVRRDPDAGPAFVGEEANIQAVVVGADGRPKPGVPVRATIRSLDGSAAPATVTIDSANGAVDIPYVSREPGRHRVELETKAGVTTSLLFWVLPEEGSDVPAPAGSLVVAGAKTQVAVGETAELLVWAPFEGRLRLSVERDRVLWGTTVEIDASVSRVRVPVLSSFVPNAYVVARLAGAGRRAYATAPLKVDTTPNQLAVSVQAPSRATAGRTVNVTVKTGQRAYAVVYAVPFERLDVRLDPPADPFEHFVGSQPLSVTTYDRSAFGQAEDGASVRSGAVRAPAVEWSMASSAWTQIATIDGSAVLPVTLPFTHGPVRVGVVAFADERFGSAVGTIDVQDPLRMRTNIPRFLHPGDVLSIPVELENGLERSLSVNVTTSARGPLKARGIGGPVTVRANGSTRLSAKIEVAQAVGDGRIVLGAVAETASTTVSRIVTVKPPRDEKIQGASYEVTKDSPATLVIPKTFLAGAADARLAVGPTPMYAHVAALDRVLAEARGVPLGAAYEALALTFAARLRSDGEPRLREALVRLASPSSNSPRDAVIEALAVFFAARYRGVDRATIERTFTRMSAFVETPPADDPLALALAHFALAVADRPNRRSLIALSEKWTAEDATPNPQHLAVLGAAAMRAGMLTLGRRMVPDQLAVDPDLTPLMLLVLADVSPYSALVTGMHDELRARAVGGAWEGVETSALALAGIAMVSRRRSPEKQYWGTVTLGSELLKRFNTTRSAILETPLGAWSKGSVVLEVTGGGRAYAGLSVIGVPSSPPPVVSKGLEVKRTILTPAGRNIEGKIPFGELVVVQLSVRCTTEPTCGRIVVDERVAAGLEVEDPDLTGLEWFVRGARRPRYTKRPDRMRYEVELDQDESAFVYYVARAISEGTFVSPALVATAGTLRATTASGSVSIGSD